MKHLFIGIIYSTVFISCSIKSQDLKPTIGDKRIIVRDGEGNIKTDIEYINDTTMHGMAKFYYYPLNIISDEIEMCNGKKNGWHKHYRKNGTLESKSYFIDNIPNGKNIWFYSDGINIEVENNWKDSVQYGQTKWFYRNGSIQSLSYKNLFGEVFYLLDFDSVGNKIKEEGNVFSPTLYTKKDCSKLAKNDTLLIKISIAELPNLTTSIKMGALGKELELLEIKDYTAVYQNVFKETGNYTLVTIGEIRESNGNLYKKDSITVDITVVD